MYFVKKAAVTKITLNNLQIKKIFNRRICLSVGWDRSVVKNNHINRFV